MSTGRAVAASSRWAASPAFAWPSTTTSVPRPARASACVSVRFTALPIPTACSRHPAGNALRDSPHDLVLEADLAIAQQNHLTLGLVSQGAQCFLDPFAHLGAPPSLQLGEGRQGMLDRALRHVLEPRGQPPGLIREREDLESIPCLEAPNQGPRDLLGAFQWVACHGAAGIDDEA